MPFTFSPWTLQASRTFAPVAYEPIVADLVVGFARTICPMREVTVPPAVLGEDWAMGDMVTEAATPTAIVVIIAFLVTATMLTPRSGEQFSES
ncbi:hypothetical protein ABT095_08570 [Kitasatospora sp. NPDC002227]|uniref:hypothetical protein n=1 Tax=Kitasatospora sp. NPDC002227 TaxID=3154773 RepID=UPI00331E38E3